MVGEICNVGGLGEQWGRTYTGARPWHRRNLQCWWSGGAMGQDLNRGRAMGGLVSLIQGWFLAPRR
jgi:hypothetical protein